MADNTTPATLANLIEAYRAAEHAAAAAVEWAAGRESRRRWHALERCK